MKSVLFLPCTCSEAEPSKKHLRCFSWTAPLASFGNKKHILTAIFLLLLAFSAFGQEELISVLPLNSSGGVSALELSNLTMILESAMTETHAFKLVESEERNKILEELKFSNSGCSDENCALEIGKMLAAEYMVYGTVNKSGGSYLVSIKKANVGTGEIEINTIETMVSMTPAQMKETSRRLAYGLAGMELSEEEAEIQSFTGSVRIDVEQTEASAVFNLSREIATFPQVITDVPVGTYPLRVTAEGYESRTLSVSVRKGEETDVHVKLEKVSGEPVRPSRGEGFLSIFTSPPGMKVFINYRELSGKLTPLENYSLPAGDCTISLIDPDAFFEDQDIPLTIAEGASNEISVEMERRRGKLQVRCPVEGASVYINGQKRGFVKEGNILIPNLPTGLLEVAVSMDRYKTETREITLTSTTIFNLSVELQPSPVKVIFDSNPPGAEVFFNGELLGKTPVLREDVAQGSYTYSFTYRGYETPTRNLDISSVEDETIIEDLYGSLAVSLSDPGDFEAEVELDGRYQGTTENGRFHSERIALGNHVLVLRKDGYQSETLEFLHTPEQPEIRQDLLVSRVAYAVTTEPAGAMVKIDGIRQIGVTPFSVNLDEGTHEIEVSMAGFMPMKESVTVESVRGKRLRYTLVPGENAEALMDHFRELGESLEKERTGILQARETADSFEELMVELEAFSGDLSQPRAYLEERRDFYRDRQQSLEMTVYQLKDSLDYSTARRDRMEKNRKILWTSEIISGSITVLTGVGSFIFYNKAMEAYSDYQDADESLDAADYRDDATRFGSISDLLLGITAGLGVVDIGLPVTALIVNGNLTDIEPRISRIAARIARLEMTRNQDMPLSDQDADLF